MSLRPWVTLLTACLVACAAKAPRVHAPEAPARTETAAVAHAELATPGNSRPPTPDEARLIKELMADTERIRGLGFRAPIEVRIQDRAAMRAYVSDAIEEDDLVRARRRYLALGLLDPSIDVRDLLESLMEEELIGYYDPKAKRLAVRDDVARSLGHRGGQHTDLEWRATVVHELVHALQDQHLGLGAAMDVDRTTDADDAFGALVEGDATLAMLGYAAELSGVAIETLAADPRGLAESLHIAPERLTGALRSAPSIVREPLLFRYREGTLFAAKLFTAGGWERVDEAHRVLPASTLEVEEPKRYLERRGDHGLRMFDLSSLTEHGYRLIDEDVLGSFELATVLGDAGLSARAMAPLWRGDRYAVLEADGKSASVWCLRFDSRATARKVAAALERLPSHGDARVVLQEGVHVLALRGIAEEHRAQLEGLFRAWVRGER